MVHVDARMFLCLAGIEAIEFSFDYSHEFCVLGNSHDSETKFRTPGLVFHADLSRDDIDLDSERGEGKKKRDKCKSCFHAMVLRMEDRRDQCGINMQLI